MATRRIFLIDQADRAGEQAANSLLKTLEEPPDHLILILTAENVYDLLPTIRSRSVVMNFSPLSNDEMKDFARVRGNWTTPSGGLRCRAGVPAWRRRSISSCIRSGAASMLALLKTGAGVSPYAAWLPVSETLGRSKSEKLELHLKLLYDLLRDLTVLREGGTGRSAISICATNSARWRKKFRAGGSFMPSRAWTKSPHCCAEIFRRRSRSTGC